MKLTRREFLKNSSILTGAILLNSNIRGENLFPSGSLIEIRNSIGIYNNKGGTIGWYFEDDVVVVIDSQFPASAKSFKEELNGKSAGKIDYLFNTHHHGDHTSGNYFLQNHTDKIVAHENCPRLQTKQNKGKETASRVVTANITFKNELRIKFLKESVNAIHFGKAHTGGDIAVHFENANIAHLGDLVFNNVTPYIDNAGECSVKNWISVLNNILDYFDNHTSFIFGHANDNNFVVGKKIDIIRMKNYLEALHDHVNSLILDGKDIHEIESSNRVPGFDFIREKWESARKMNLKATAEQLLQ